MHTFIRTSYVYTQYFCVQYTCIYWQCQYILYLCMLTVSIHSSLCDNENPTTHSISVGLDAQCWRQNQCHHHLNRPHLARLCVGPVHWCVSASPMRLSAVWIATYPSWGRGSCCRRSSVAGRILAVQVFLLGKIVSFPCVLENVMMESAHCAVTSI